MGQSQVASRKSLVSSRGPSWPSTVHPETYAARRSGTGCASARGMKAKNLEDVLVYRKSIAAADEVSALLKRPVFGKDLELRDQLSRSPGRVAPLIADLQRCNWKSRGIRPDND